MSIPAYSTQRSTLAQGRLRQTLLTILALLVTLGASAAIGITDQAYLVFGAVMAAILALAILVRPELGVYVLIVFIFANLSDVLETQFGIPSTNKFLVALIFAGIFASRILLRKQPAIFQLTEIVILGYGVVIIGSLFFAAGGEGGLGLIVDWLKDFAILLILVQFATEEHVWKRAQWVLILTATVLAALSCYQAITGDYTTDFHGLANAPLFQVTQDLDNHRVTGPIDDPNFYAMFLLMVLPLAVYRFLTARSRNARLSGLIASSILALAIVFTYSRGALVAMIVVGVLIALERRISPYKIAPVLVAIAIVLLPMLPPGFMDRVSTLDDILSGSRSQTELSLRGRYSEAIVAYWMFLDHPVFGVGSGNFESNYLSYSSRLGTDQRYEERRAHSLYLELAAETGIAGLLSFSAMLAALFAGMRRARRMLRSINRDDLVGWVLGLQYGLIGFLLASIFLHSDYIRYFWLLVGLCASCIVVAQTQKARLERRDPVLGLSAQ